MRTTESHGRLNFWTVAWVVAIPAAVALVGGLWLAWQVAGLKGRQIELGRMDEVSTQARWLSDGFSAELHALRDKAFAIQARREIPAASPILYWAELELPAGAPAPVIRAALRNPSWSRKDPVAAPISSDDAYLQSSLQQLRFHETMTAGIGALRIRQDPQKSAEWLAVAFAARGSLLVALVQPTDAFPVFRRWSARQEGRSRAYLLASDGRVLAHTQKAYEGADFSALPVQAQAGEILSGHRASGAGLLSSIDLSDALTAVVKARGLPFALVVEQVAAPLSGAGLASELAGDLGGLIAAIFLGVLSICALCAWAVLHLHARGRGAVRATTLEEAPSAPSPETELALLKDAPMAMPPPFHGHSESPEASSDAGASGDPEDSAPPNAGVEGIRFDEFQLDSISASYEEAPSEELPGDAPTLRALPGAEAPETPASVSGVYQEYLEYNDESDTVALQVAEMAHRLCQAPTLFFSHYPQARAAVLQACAGVPDALKAGVDLNDLAFPILEQMSVWLRDSDLLASSSSQLFSLNEYFPLSQLLLSRLGTGSFQAWAVKGSGAGELLGVLVVLREAELSGEQYASLAQLIRTTETIYESTLTQ